MSIIDTIIDGINGLEDENERLKSECEQLKKLLDDKCDRCLDKIEEVKFDYDEDDYGETVEQVIVDDQKYIDIEYFGRKITEKDLQIEKLKKALKLAVADKCDFENKYLSIVLGIGNGKVIVPKKEQWYLEKAKEMMKSE